jgi:SET domain-containing protein
VDVDGEICRSYTGGDISQGSNMRRVIVRRSSVHGKGVFAARPLAAGERVLEYKGEITAWHVAVRRHWREGIEGHTFLFGLSDGRVIDGSCGGNSSRWLNHSCAPNCESVEDRGRIFIHTVRPIEAGQELFIEYLLATDNPMDDEVRAQYACRCAAACCRQSMLATAA